ncbi:hypothetical protein SF12_18435 [Streptomyces sp. MBRL 601]|nr:hypothetical protein SF12_18435 [Streptomyces sp. MBRL 601]
MPSRDVASRRDRHASEQQDDLPRQTARRRGRRRGQQPHGHDGQFVQVPRPVAICADMARTRSPGAKPGARLATTIPASSQPGVIGKAGPAARHA